MKFLFYVLLLAVLVALVVYILRPDSGNTQRLQELIDKNKQIQHQVDSLKNSLELTRDSLEIAFYTIRLKADELEMVKKETTRQRKYYEGIIHTVHTDSSRAAKVAELYPSYRHR